MAESEEGEIPELTEDDFAHAIKASVRRRLIRGVIQSGSEIAALRRFVGLSKEHFAEALGVSVGMLQSWEQDQSKPEGPALALLRIAARHPRVLRENVASAA